MNKVYVVTSGEYSDYHIERIFQSEEKANQYVKARHNVPHIEVYNFADDNLNTLITEGKLLRGSITLEGKSEVWLDDECEQSDKYMVLGESDEYCYIGRYIKTYQLYMSKFIPKIQWKNEKSIRKFEKILIDKITEIKSMFADGVDINTINEILKESI